MDRNTQPQRIPTIDINKYGGQEVALENGKVIASGRMLAAVIKKVKRFCRKLRMETSEIITFCYLRSQGIKLLRRRVERVPCSHQLPLANGMHDFDARNRTPGCPKRLEA